MAGWDIASGFHMLSLPLHRIHIIETQKQFHDAVRSLAASPQLALSVEKDMTRAQKHKRIGLLAISSWTDCYLFRIPTLKTHLEGPDWQTLAIKILTNTAICKLGYKIDGALRMLASTAPLVRDILINEPRTRIVDIFTLESKMVGKRADIFRCRVRDGVEYRPCTLSGLVLACLCRPLDQTQTASCWEQELLSEPQMKHAALGAYCLLEVYKVLRMIAEQEQLGVALERSIDLRHLLRDAEDDREQQGGAAGTRGGQEKGAIAAIPASLLDVANQLQGLDVDMKVTVAALLIAQQTKQQEETKDSQKRGKATQGTCRFFNTPNGCHRRNCKFAHVKESGILEKKNCSYFNTPKGCQRGDACAFAHVKEEKRSVCLYFSSPSGCRLGDKCNYEHVQSSETAPTARGDTGGVGTPSSAVARNPLTSKLKKEVRSEARLVRSPHDMSTYQVKLEPVSGPCGGVTRKFKLGSPRPGSMEKVILLIGATGAGKTTLINSMVNFLFGLDYEDDFRFQLVHEDQTQANQARSQTQHITAYSLHHQDGFNVPFSLTIIDTPGFGDTQGISRDKQITRELHAFFQTTGGAGVDHIDAVGFVVQSALARLTPTQKYVFDSILSVFGKDIEENVCVLVTFADNDKPPVLAAVAEAKITYTQFYKFNNSAMFSDNKSGDVITEKTWSMGMDNYKTFFQDLLTLKPKSLLLTNNVMRERECLELCVVQIQHDIKLGLNKLEQLSVETDVLQKHESEMNRNKNFTYEVQEDKVVKRHIPVGQHTTTCLTCNRTCHENCSYADDAQKMHCVAMQPDGTCRICPGKCVWQMHKNLPHVLVVERQTVTKTSNNLKLRYESAAGRSLSAQQVVDAICDEIIELRRQILIKTSDVRAILARLQNIALKPNPLSELDYIDVLIESEKSEAQPGWKKRVEQLLEVRKQAEYMKKISQPNYDPFKEYNKAELRQKVKTGKTEKCTIQ